jgi:hypothetical protein
LESLDVGESLASFDSFGFNFSTSELAATGPVAVNIGVDPADKPSTFHPNDVGNLLQSQLAAKVFNNLVAGSVQIKVALQGTAPGQLGWIGRGKTRYDTRVVWKRGGVPYGGYAISGGGNTTVNLDKIEAGFAQFRGNPGVQFWVNLLAHESIWINAGGNYDSTMFNPAPDGDIHSGTVNPFDPFAVSPDSRLTLIRKFGLKAN